jgi:hypothetical protein
MRDELIVVVMAYVVQHSKAEKIGQLDRLCTWWETNWSRLASGCIDVPLDALLETQMPLDAFLATLESVAATLRKRGSTVSGAELDAVVSSRRFGFQDQDAELLLDALENLRNWYRVASRDLAIVAEPSGWRRYLCAPTLTSKHGRHAARSLSEIDNCADNSYATIPLTTLPCTSVRRYCLP